MKLLNFLVLPLLSLGIGSSLAASWGFEDATLSIQGKGAGVGGAVKEKYVPGPIGRYNKADKYLDSPRTHHCPKISL